MSTLKLTPFEYFEPVSIEETAALLSQFGGEARILAGGIDLIPRLRSGTVKTAHLINIQRVAGLDYMRRGPAGELEFGAMTSIHSLERWEDLKRGYTALYDAMHQITSVQTKCMGTAVGNLCVATPASDVAPALAAYGAELLISGPEGERRVPVADFYPSYGRTVLGRGELVTGVWVPAVPVGQGAAFMNLVRTHADIAKVTVTVAVVLEEGVCRSARIALGSVAPTMFRAHEAELLLQGRELTDERVREGAAVAAAEAAPIDDIRSSAEYRKATAEVLVGRALHKAGERARAGVAGALPHVGSQGEVGP